MTRQPPPTDPPDACTPVWSALPSDLQRRAVRLLAQLAFAQFRYHPPPTPQETAHAAAPQQPHDPA